MNLTPSQTLLRNMLANSVPGASPEFIEKMATDLEIVTTFTENIAVDGPYGSIDDAVGTNNCGYVDALHEVLDLKASIALGGSEEFRTGFDLGVDVVKKMVRVLLRQHEEAQAEVATADQHDAFAKFLAAVCGLEPSAR